MRVSEKVLKYVMITFLVTSICTSTISIFELFSKNRTFISLDAFYDSLSQFSGLHSFTLAIVATYFGLKRLRLTQESNERALYQFSITHEEVERRRMVEMNSETLRRCELYLTNFQSSLKELIQKNQYSGMPVKWSKLEQINRESLKNNYEITFNRIEKAEEELKMESLIFLHELNAFSAFILYGNIELKLAKEMIGDMFCKQIEMLTGLIAYYQPKGNESVFKYIIELKKKWQD